MNGKVDEEFLKSLLAKRKHSKIRILPFSWLDITADEREKLYEQAEMCGLLTKYQFSGIQSSGISRNDAGRRLLDKTRRRAFEKLKVEFGAKAHFWARPVQLSFLDIDFYWKLAKLGVHVTGPLKDDLWRPGRTRIRDTQLVAPDASLMASMAPNYRGLAVLNVPYYVVWHRPSEFVSRVGEKLVESGKYPKLIEVSKSKQQF